MAVTVSVVALGACADESDEPTPPELRPVSLSEAPRTPVIDREPAVPRKVRERPRRKHRRDGGGIQKAGSAPAVAAAPRRAPVRSAPAPAPPAASPAPPRQPATTPSKPSGGGGQARAKAQEFACNPRCP
ncbi:MAG TPA: hypothetical protein VF712_19800 [Thermoleophilaceae bacterium]